MISLLYFADYPDISTFVREAVLVKCKDFAKELAVMMEEIGEDFREDKEDKEGCNKEESEEESEEESNDDESDEDEEDLE